MAEILWLNHAGYELRVGQTRIVHDPWLFGLAFDKGWSLVSESVFQPQDFEGVDFIWLSHEHPDHFSPPVLKSIPKYIRQSITILYQQTRDRRVLQFCENLGFKTLELPDCQRIQIAPELALTCGKVGSDSWLLAEAGDKVVFNANDCSGCDWEEIARHVDRDIDLYLTQFSYAIWTGNPGETDRMEMAARDKVAEMSNQIAAFKPKQVIPFASYVWFCREENFHLNQCANRVAKIYSIFDRQHEVVVLYPGDRFEIGSQHDSSDAVNRYEKDWEKNGQPLNIENDILTLGEIKIISNKNQCKIYKNNIMFLLKPLAWIKFIRPIYIYLEDIDCTVKYCMFGGLLEDTSGRKSAEIEFSAGSFSEMLRNGYGFNTLMINGRYREVVPGAMHALSRNFAISARNEEGYFLPGLFFKFDYIKLQIVKIFKYIFSKL